MHPLLQTFATESRQYGQAFCRTRESGCDVQRTKAENKATRTIKKLGKILKTYVLKKKPGAVVQVAAGAKSVSIDKALAALSAKKDAKAEKMRKKIEAAEEKKKAAAALPDPRSILAPAAHRHQAGGKFECMATCVWARIPSKCSAIE